MYIVIKYPAVFPVNKKKPKVFKLNNRFNIGGGEKITELLNLEAT